jgi:hypothetical protein
VITVYEMGEQRGLLDGQHRVGALKMLAESDVLISNAHLVLVEVFPVRQEEDIKRCVHACVPACQCVCAYVRVYGKIWESIERLVGWFLGG